MQRQFWAKALNYMILPCASAQLERVHLRLAVYPADPAHPRLLGDHPRRPCPL